MNYSLLSVDNALTKTAIQYAFITNEDLTDSELNTRFEDITLGHLTIFSLQAGNEFAIKTLARLISYISDFFNYDVILNSSGNASLIIHLRITTRK